MGFTFDTIIYGLHTDLKAYYLMKYLYGVNSLAPFAQEIRQGITISCIAASARLVKP